MLSSRQLAELKLLKIGKQLSAYEVFKLLSEDSIVVRQDIAKDMEALEREGYIENSVSVFLPRRAKIYKLTKKRWE
jgi:hypothetical protein